MTKKVITFVWVFWLLCPLTQAAQQFPFVGEITADKVNVRAGPNLNFEQLCKMKKGQDVLVLEKSYGWYKIRLPDEAACYVHSKYVTQRFEDIGRINANHVHIRAGAGENFSVLGQLKKDERVKIRGQVQDWYKIDPVEQSYAWVIDQFVNFKSNQIPPPRVVVEPSRNIYLKAAPAELVEGTVAQPPAPPQPSPADAKKKDFESFSAIGILEDLGRFMRAKNLRYKLIVDNKTVYYVEGDLDVFNRWVHYPVKVEGKIKGDPAGVYKYPVISVSKIGPAP